MLFFEVSAKDATNVNVAFNEIARMAMESQEKINLQFPQLNTNTRQKGRKGLNQKKKGK